MTMKKLFSILFAPFLAIMALSASAQAPADTVAVVKDAKNVTLTSTGDGVNLMILNDKGRLDYRYYNQTLASDSIVDDWNLEPVFTKRKKHEIFTTCTGSIFAGFSWLLDNPDGFEVGGEWGYKDVCAFQWEPSNYTSLSLGVGFQLNWYQLNKGRILTQDGHRLLVQSASKEMSKAEGYIFMTSFLLPLTFTQHISDDFGFSLSAIANIWPFWTKASTTYRIGDDKYIESFKHLEYNFITPEFMFTVGWVGSIGAYVKYNPCSRFRDGYGPKFKSLSAGINLIF